MKVKKGLSQGRLNILGFYRNEACVIIFVDIYHEV